MKILCHNRCQAFTRVECCMIGMIVFLLMVAMLPTLLGPHHGHRIHCVSNLRQVGLAFRNWAEDNGGKYPMEVAMSQGGAQELVATGNVAGCFQVMSNELSTPKILFCPEDRGRAAGANFSITRANISYFVGYCGTNGQLAALLSGDDNLMQNGRAVPPGNFELSANTASWLTARHRGAGNILLPDGSVRISAQIGFSRAPGTFLATNRLVVP